MSQSKLYVGNLAYGVNNESLRDRFSKYGAVADARVIMDKATGRSKGFGFVAFEDAQAAEAALVENGQEFDGRRIKVNVALEEGSRSSGGGGFGGGRSREGGSGRAPFHDRDRDDRR